MAQKSDTTVLKQLLTFNHEFKSFRSEIHDEFKKVNDEAQNFRNEVNDGFKKVNDEAQNFRNEVNDGFKKVNDEAQSFRAEVIDGFKKVNDEAQSFRREVIDGFKKVNDEAQSFRAEVNTRFELVDKQLSRHEKRLFRLEQTTHQNGVLLEDTSRRMELAGEGIESILKTVNRLVLGEEERKYNDIRINAIETWTQEHQRAHDEGKI